MSINPINSIGSTTVGEIPRVVAVIAGTPSDFPSLAERAKDEKADILEFRADYCYCVLRDKTLGLLRTVKLSTGLPILLTIRQFTEGGYFVGSQSRFAGSESERLELFKYLLPEADAVDIEIHSNEIRDEVIRFAKSLGKMVIVSYHNFRRTPHLAKLNELADDAIACGADMLKVAVTAADEADVQLLSRFTSEFDKNILLTTISMGEVGTISRVLNPFLGSCLTFGFIGNEPTTPGQIRVKKLSELIAAFPGQRITDVLAAEEMVHAAFEGRVPEFA